MTKDAELCDENGLPRVLRAVLRSGFSTNQTDGERNEHCASVMENSRLRERVAMPLDNQLICTSMIRSSALGVSSEFPTIGHYFPKLRVSCAVSYTARATAILELSASVA